MNYRYRLIKPLWAQPRLPNGKENPNFKEEVQGPNIIEGSFSEKELRSYNDKGYNIYYFPNGASKVEGKFLNGKEIDQYNVVFVDMDLKDEEYPSKEAFLAVIGKFPVKPSKIVDSGNGIHVYWSIADLTREDYIAAQFSLINYFKTDTSVWTPLQLMRVGSYYNTKKHGKYVMANVLYEDGSVYQIEELLVNLEPPSESQMKKLDKHCAKLDGTFIMPEFNEIDFNTLPPSFIHLMETNERVRELYHNPKEAAGDRSVADYSLANLLFDAEYDFSECVQVISNGVKAKERSDGNSYAFNTVEKVYGIRTEEVSEKEGSFQLMSDLLREDGFEAEIGTPVNGAYYWDCLATKWQTSQVLGIIAGPGVGKTETTLHNFKNMAQADPDSLFVFFSLEMPERQIAKRWLDVIEGDKTLCDNVIVIGNEDKDGMPRNIGIQEIYNYVIRIEKRFGKKVKTVVIDHINILDKDIDTSKKPKFKAEFENKHSRGDIKTLTPKGLLSACKQLAKTLDVFLIIQSQTTKEKAGDGDMALGLSAAYGNSAFEWYCDLIITLWQPLRMVQDETELKVLGWQYVKIREQDDRDGVKVNSKRTLKYDRINRSFKGLTSEEWREFIELMKQVNEKRKLKEKKTLNDYKNTDKIRLVQNYMKKGG